MAIATTALIAVLLLNGAGSAAADPDQAGSAPDGGSTSEPPAGEPDPTIPPSTAPQPTTPTTQTAQLTQPLDLPSAIAGALRDFFNRPLSIFGNGRVPGQPPAAVVVNAGGATSEKDQGRRDGSRVDPTAKPVVKPEPQAVLTGSVMPLKRTSSGVDEVPPFSPPVSIPVRPVPVPGFESLRLTIDLSDPDPALQSLQATADTVNSLLADAYAPYDPCPPPVPRPQVRTQEPQFKIMEEEPVIDAGPASVTPVAQSSSDLPVLQAPPLVLPVRMVLPLPVRGTSPAVTGATPQVTGAGALDVRGPVVRGSVPRSASAQRGETVPNTPASAAGERPVVRQGYQQYLQSARGPRVAVIAVPGLIGLLALTASGVVTGYRQANSQRYLRSDAARFLR